MASDAASVNGLRPNILSPSEIAVGEIAWHTHTKGPIIDRDSETQAEQNQATKQSPGRDESSYVVWPTLGVSFPRVVNSAARFGTAGIRTSCGRLWPSHSFLPPGERPGPRHAHRQSLVRLAVFPARRRPHAATVVSRCTKAAGHRPHFRVR